jgi:hypothetical protein
MWYQAVEPIAGWGKPLGGTCGWKIDPARLEVETPKPWPAN